MPPPPPPPSPEEAKAAFEKEKDDPAMQAYLKSLGLDPNYVAPEGDDRRVVVKSLEISFKDHAPTKLSFETDEDLQNAKKTPLVIKEGSDYKISVTFRVQHTLVAGFKIESTVKKIGKTVSSDTEMLGSFPPSNEWTTIDIGGGDFSEAPSGLMLRGEYKGRMKFVDDDGHTHLDFEYTLKFAKDWKDE